MAASKIWVTDAAEYGTSSADSELEKNRSGQNDQSSANRQSGTTSPQSGQAASVNTQQSVSPTTDQSSAAQGQTPTVPAVPSAATAPVKPPAPSIPGKLGGAAPAPGTLVKDDANEKALDFKIREKIIDRMFNMDKERREDEKWKMQHAATVAERLSTQRRPWRFSARMNGVTGATAFDVQWFDPGNTTTITQQNMTQGDGFDSKKFLSDLYGIVNPKKKKSEATDQKPIDIPVKWGPTIGLMDNRRPGEAGFDKSKAVADKVKAKRLDVEKSKAVAGAAAAEKSKIEDARTAEARRRVESAEAQSDRKKKSKSAAEGGGDSVESVVAREIAANDAAIRREGAVAAVRTHGELVDKYRELHEANRPKSEVPWWYPGDAQKRYDELGQRGEVSLWNRFNPDNKLSVSADGRLVPYEQPVEKPVEKTVPVQTPPPAKVAAPRKPDSIDRMISQEMKRITYRDGTPLLRQSEGKATHNVPEIRFGFGKERK